MIDLEHALFDLAEHLDHPTGDDLIGAVRARISVPVVGALPRPRRARALVAVAAVLVLVVGAVLTIPPTRHAIADWLGIGAVDIRHSTGPLPTGVANLTVPGAPAPAPGAPNSAAVARKLAAARAAVRFPIAMPRDPSAGALLGVSVDRRVPGGLAVLRYRAFTLVEIATQSGSVPFAKYADPSVDVEPVAVRGRPGLWIDGAHDVAYLDRRGHVRFDTLRRSGPVLLWARAGVTYRIEGFDQQADAIRMATSVR